MNGPFGGLRVGNYSKKYGCEKSSANVGRLVDIGFINYDFLFEKEIVKFGVFLTIERM